MYENVVAHDCLFLPSITTELKANPVYHSMYNQLKQEFVSARYLFFEGVAEKQSHFNDEHNYQTDTLDYSIYSLNIEKIKLAFKTCYSLFDKVGYFLNHYLNLGLQPRDASFRSIW